MDWKIAKMANFGAVLALADDFRTINWIEEYPYPTLALKEIEGLLAI